MRQMAFSLTTAQVRDRSKTVTRRVGWVDLKPGTLIKAVEQGMGLPKGATVNTLAILRVVDVRVEPLNAITADDVVREGFPHLTPDEFVTMFWRSHRGCRYDTPVTRIEFKYVNWSYVDTGDPADTETGEVLR